MTNFDIAFSLNRQMNITADTFEQAEEQVKAKLKEEGIDLDAYTFEVFDVNEEE